jgi:hypothetical protein
MTTPNNTCITRATAIYTSVLKTLHAWLVARHGPVSLVNLVTAAINDEQWASDRLENSVAVHAALRMLREAEVSGVPLTDAQCSCTLEDLRAIDASRPDILACQTVNMAASSTPAPQDGFMPQPVLAPAACTGASTIDGVHVCNNERDCSLRLRRKLSKPVRTRPQTENS